MVSQEVWTTPAEEGRRLDQVVAERFGLTRSQAERHIEDGAVTIDGAAPPRGKRTPMRAGMCLRYDRPPPRSPGLEPEPMPLSVLHEDEHLLALDKPAGIVVHPGEGHHRGTLLAGVLAHVGRLPETDPVRPGVVHRLDKGTTGVIVFAKSPAAHAALVDAFRDREVEKTYLAVVQGVPRPESGRFETKYGRDPRHRQRFSSKVLEGKEAITEYEVLEAYPGAAAVQVGLETGRTHQIRVHFSDAGHALIGDDTYVGRASVRDPLTREASAGFPRPALHAWELRLRHPVTGARLRFSAPLPADMTGLIERLREVAAARVRP